MHRNVVLTQRRGSKDRARLFILIFCELGVLVSAGDAAGQTCDPRSTEAAPPTPVEHSLRTEVRDAYAIVWGVVDPDVPPNLKGSYLYSFRLRVRRYLKGSGPETIEVSELEVEYTSGAPGTLQGRTKEFLARHGGEQAVLVLYPDYARVHPGRPFYILTERIPKGFGFFLYSPCDRYAFGADSSARMLADLRALGLGGGSGTSPAIWLIALVPLAMIGTLVLRRRAKSAQTLQER
ncbi:MAG: hypothetical protein ABR552_06405 [Actinomycetota bacterium]